MKELPQKIVENIRVDVTEEFDRNFERKSFFSNPKWPPTKKPVSRGSLLLRSGAMRSSLSSTTQGNKIIFTSSVPYFAIHNDGGEINRISKKGKPYKITMPQRQVVGHHEEVDRIVRENIDEQLPEWINENMNECFAKWKK